MADRSTAFLFDVLDWRSSRTVQRMTFAQRGMYLEMLLEQWDKGDLPDDPVAVADLLGGTVDEWTAAWPVLRRRFVDRRSHARNGDEPIPTSHDASRRIVNLRLEHTRKERRAYLKRLAENGRKGGLSKAQKSKGLPSSKAIAPLQPSSSQALALLSTGKERNGRERNGEERSTSGPPARAFRDPSPSEVPTDVAERAGRFCERYASLYQQHRKGARYVSKPALDFQEALLLCQTWDDDARLDKIATVFLTTDHEFAERGNRTMAQFRSLASWCDSRLREAGL